MNLARFLETYVSRGPAKPPDNEDQLRPVGIAQGVVDLVTRSASALATRPSSPGMPEGRALWVIVAHPEPAIPSALERLDVVPPLESGVVKHTNLTGGGPACCGGELWVDEADERLLYVNGGSGRYAPRTPQELAHAVEVLVDCGFSVRSAGWDDDVQRPARVFR